MSQEMVKANLYLYAVLPLLEEVVKRDKEAKEIVKDLTGVIQFGAPDGLAAQVEFKDGGVKATRGKGKKPTVSLYLPSLKMLNNLFEDKFAIPLPVKGLFKMGLVTGGFTNVAKRLSHYMEMDAPKGEAKELVATLLMTAAIFGAAQVGNVDESAADKVKKIPDGIAHIEIKGGPSVYIVKEGKTFTAHKGVPDDYTVYLGFKDYDAAYGMLNNEIDLMAAIALGTIELSGSLAILEQLAPLMETAGDYLE